MLVYGPPEASPLKPVWFTPARRHRLGFFHARFWNIGSTDRRMRFRLMGHGQRGRSRMRTRWLGKLIVAGGFALVTLGCAQPHAFGPDTRLLDGPGPYAYSDRDWAEVLRDYTRDGLVDYAGLAAHHRPLDQYYALLGVTGPSRTPDQFPSSAHAAAYWINAYNAAVLLFVLEHYPDETIYEVGKPKIELATFRMDGQTLTLPQMEARILRITDGDVRALFATSRGALGTPRLPAEPLQAATLEAQIAQATADALNDPRILRIDESVQQVLVWQVVLAHRDDFERYYVARRRVANGSLLSVLMDMAASPRRQELERAAAYTLRTMPFDGRLNGLNAQVAGGQ